MRAICLILACAALFALGACPHKHARNYTGKDREMAEIGALFVNAIESYKADHGELPADLLAVAGNLPAGTPWPVSPYDGQPVADSGSPDFDAARSSGTVYYEKYIRDEQIVGYRVHVFGDKGKLLISDRTAMGAQ